MGRAASFLASIFLLGSLTTASAAHKPLPTPLSAPQGEMDRLQKQIGLVESDLLEMTENNASVALQMKKIKRLMALQKKEIALSVSKVKVLEESLGDLSDQKTELDRRVVEQKHTLRKWLRELQAVADTEPLDFSWLQNLDLLSQKEYFSVLIVDV